MDNGTEEQETTSNEGANAPLRQEIPSRLAPSSVIARRRQGDEVPGTGDTRPLRADCCARFPFSKRQEFIDLEEQARKRGLGLWNRR